MILQLSWIKVWRYRLNLNKNYIFRNLNFGKFKLNMINDKICCCLNLLRYPIFKKFLKTIKRENIG